MQKGSGRERPRQGTSGKMATGASAGDPKVGVRVSAREVKEIHWAV